MRKGLALFLNFVVLCGLVACGNSTGVDETPSDEIPNIDGSWTYTNTWSVNGLFSCRYAPSSLTIDQTGGTFTGRLVTSDLLCSTPDEPEEVSEGQNFGNPIVNGTVNAAGDVTFDPLDETGRHTGRVNGNSMSGSLLFGGVPGTWAASR